MNLLEISPADWLRDLLARQPDIREAAPDLPPHADSILVHTQAGQRLRVSVKATGIYQGPQKG